MVVAIFGSPLLYRGGRLSRYCAHVEGSRLRRDDDSGGICYNGVERDTALLMPGFVSALPILPRRSIPLPFVGREMNEQAAAERLDHPATMDSILQRLTDAKEQVMNRC